MMMRRLTRWLYSFLIRLHPGWFRQRFGEQMLSIFDDSAVDRNRFRLLFDGSVSLVRQWLFRSDTERAQRLARGMNLVWILSIIPVQIFVAAEVKPTTQTAGAALFYMVLPVCIFLSFYPILNRGFCETLRFTSISDANRNTQTTLKQRRDAFQIWAEYTGRILIACMAIWFLPVLISALFVGMQVLRSWAVVNSIVMAIQALTYFSILKRLNQRAIITIQQQIEHSM